ncbi:hypothetical protein A3I47_04415 [Candidatus Kaiserbacteria bacterium RIFCSPLOWO2_02_FULL_59_19]|nr:MAG: hypothetical protein A3I47_04415 [Candidatus Kaiserbacteria bacterium RIFCSPLOWO2_02_FULL_59_19]
MELYPNKSFSVIRKTVGNKPFFYLTTRVKVGKKLKKIQVYIGKRVPNDLRPYYERTKDKELALAEKMVAGQTVPGARITQEEYVGVERARISLLYGVVALSEAKREQWWRRFAIDFIFESNAIEGSRLSQQEVEAIVRNRYVKRFLTRNEVREVENAIKALAMIRERNFRLSERSIITLHALVTRELGVLRGYKRRTIVVNNKPTTRPGRVRAEMSSLLAWWKRHRAAEHPFFLALMFHQRLERIHPFEDGNGRVGRLILIWMLLKEGYGIILFRNRKRRAYFSALGKADDGRPRALFRYGITAYKDTAQKFAI